VKPLILLLAIATARVATAQEIRIGIIDFYGLQRTALADARAALTFKEGDLVDEELAPQRESEQRLARLPGVAHAHVNMVCCDDGRAIVYVGIEERGSPVMRFHAPPRGTERLPAEIVEAGTAFETALWGAVQRGQAGEDRTQGHTLSEAPDLRAVQERFLAFARDPALLRRVLRGSADAAHRALAAQVLGYVDDKQAVVADLVRAMRDPDENVRNNAMRALLVFAYATPTPRHPTPRVPGTPFIDFLSSPVWTDRNKSSGALAELSRTRDPRLLARLRTTALGPLVEMARWKSAGHAEAALIILARLAGRPDADATAALNGGDREAIISAATAAARR
jgi:hypothetical protein